MSEPKQSQLGQSDGALGQPGDRASEQPSDGALGQPGDGALEQPKAPSPRLSAKDSDLILGTAGHIDHGKSSLIKALTGTDPDRLLEEKRRGITIELGFAQLTLTDGTTMGVVDVPGHERFVRQMISGSTGVDVALLCIAADDGIMPQTLEHLAVLELLDIESCVVALTKADMVDEEWLGFVIDEIKTFLATTTYVDAPIIPTSIKQSSGLEELKAALSHAVARHKKTQRSSVARMPVDRVFTIKGSGTVVTGTLWSGTLSSDDEVEIFPTRQRARVRLAQVHGLATEEARAGNRVALNLSGLSTDDVRPGDFLAKPGAIQPTDRFDAFFSYVDPIKKWKSLESGSRIHLAHGTREVLGRILFINASEPLKPGDSALVQIRLEEPLPIMRGDRFIVRSYSPVALIGGGLVLRSHPRRKTNLTEEELSLLASLKQDDSEAIVQKCAALKKLPFAAEDISLEVEIDEAAVKEELDKLVNKAALVFLGTVSNRGWYAAPALVRSSLAKIENLLVAYHDKNPNQPGVSKSALMRTFHKNIDPAAFEVLVLEAQKKGILHISEGLLSHPKAGAHLKQAESAAGETLLEMLEASSLTPPLTQDLFKEGKVDTAVGQRALNSLEKEGKIVRINKDIHYAKSVYDVLVQKTRSYLEEYQQADAASLKDAMGLSRKYAIPVLEHFDSTRLTRREGNERTLL